MKEISIRDLSIMTEQGHYMVDGEYEMLEK